MQKCTCKPEVALRRLNYRCSLLHLATKAKILNNTTPVAVGSMSAYFYSSVDLNYSSTTFELDHSNDWAPQGAVMADTLLVDHQSHRGPL